MSIKAENDITLVRVDDGQPGTPGEPGEKGDTGTSVSNITKEFYLSTSKTTPTGGSWSSTAPLWSNGKYLWTRNKIVYTNPSSTEYTTPQCDSSWEAVNLVDIGARNLAFYSNSFEPAEMQFNTTNCMSLIEDSDRVSVRFDGTNTSAMMGCYLLTPYTITIENGEVVESSLNKFEFILSFDYRANSDLTNITGFQLRLFSYNSDTGKYTNGGRLISLANSPSFNLSQTTQWKRVESPLKVSTPLRLYNTGTQTGTYTIGIGFVINAGVAFDMSRIKLELGNKATDWSPSPEDMASLEGLENLTTNFNEAEEVINSTRADVDDITENVSGLNTSVENLNSVTGELSDQLSEELVAKGYAKITSEPSLELARGASDWKVKITNSSVDLQKAGVNGARLGANPERANETLFQADTTRISNLYFRSADSRGKLGIVAQSNGHISLKEI